VAGLRGDTGLESVYSPSPGAVSLPAKSAKEPVLTRDFLFATLANFVNSFGAQMLMATLPVYILNLGGSEVEVGLVTGVMAGTALLLRPLAGWLTDAWQRRPLVLAGTFCYGLASIVYLLAGSLPVLLLGRLVQGVGICSYTTAANSYVADVAPPSRRAEAIGIFAAAQSLGLILGPAIGFVVIAMLDFHRLFYLSASLSFAAFLLSLFARERRQKSTARRQPWSLRTGVVAIEALPMAWAALCLGFGHGATMSFLSIFAESRGLGNPGFYFTVQAVALLISRAFCGQLADRYGRSFTIVPGMVAAAIALALLPMAHDLPLFMLSAALFGLGFGAAQPATMALLVDRVPARQRGLGMSTYFTGFDTGITLGSIMLGVVAQRWGFGVMWTLAGAGTLFGLLGILRARPRPPLNHALARDDHTYSHDGRPHAALATARVISATPPNSPASSPNAACTISRPLREEGMVLLRTVV